ncbi:MAG: SapC family protein [Pseudomonadota bacterium]
MTNQLLFYKSAVPLASETHRDVCVRSDGSFEFAANVNSVPIIAAEFRPAAAECPIVFGGDGEEVFPAVILGLQDQKNLFVDDNFAWKGRYVPAFIRRYPFVFAAGEEERTFTLCIDTEYDGVNERNEGERLFDSRGERTAYLETVVGFMKEYQAQFERTKAFCKRLKELELLEPMMAQYASPSGEEGVLSGFSAVNREKLKQLKGDVLEQMLRTDELELLFIHLQSLNNMQSLAERIETAPQTEAAPKSAPAKKKKAKAAEGAEAAA